MDKNLKRRIAIEGLIFIPILVFSFLAIASGEFGIGLFLIIIYATIRFIIWSIKTIEGKDTMKETKFFKAIVVSLRFIVVFAIITFVIYLAKRSVLIYSQRSAEKSRIALQEKSEAEEREAEKREIAAQERLEIKEKENAKQIEVVNWSVDDKQPNLQSLLKERIRVALKNSSYDMAERIDLVVIYYTLNNYVIRQEILKDITGGGLLPPKSTAEFTKAITLDVPDQEYKMGLAVSRAKFKDCYYAVIKENTPVQVKGYPMEYLQLETIWRCYSLNECKQKIDSSKKEKEVVSAECMYENNRIFNVYHNKAISEWYERVIMESRSGVIAQWVNIYPNRDFTGNSKDSKLNMKQFMHLLAVGNILNIEEKNDKGTIYIVSPKGEVTTGWDNFEAIIQNEEFKKFVSDCYNDQAHKLYTKKTDLEEGLKLIDKGLEKYPNEGVYLATKAELLYAIGRYDEAYNYIKKAAGFEPNNPEIKKDVKMIEDALTGKGRK